jgi:hypothetical protein
LVDGVSASTTPAGFGTATIFAAESTSIPAKSASP